MTTYCIGIDTGGTYTDAVLMESHTRKIVASTKERTTPHDLSLGVGQALEGLLHTGQRENLHVEHLAVSTTLATNAVVEGRGARVGLFVLGYVRHFKLPVVANIFLKGGHSITGEEEEPLDIETLIDTLPQLSREVDSYALCGAMSIKNPTHELVAKEAIGLMDPKPVFCSHLVSAHPGMLERSATACLHAKLMPLMVDFLASVQRSMLRVGLECPVTIIRGNGTGIALDEVAEQAAVTMASGPAATARFGAEQGQTSALVVDIGGTTTDVCLLQDGKPLVNHEGCTIGQWQTHVEAVDMYTSGAGGDSHVCCQKDGALRLARSRVQPLAMTQNLPDPAQWLQPKGDSFLVVPSPSLTQEVAGQDELLLFLLAHGPATPSVLAQETGVGSVTLEKRLERLVFLQQVTLCGFTPTDALHAAGLLAIGDTKASEAGARILATALGIEPEILCAQVIDLTEQAIEDIILTYLSRTIWQGAKEEASRLLQYRENAYFSMEFSLKLPLIGIGAAARSFLPGVAKRLGTTVSFPERCEVGNAIGAALIGLEQ